MAGGEVSRAKKGCLRRHFERFDENGYFVKFYNVKSDFFLAKRLTTLFYDITNKDKADATIENYKLEKSFTRFDFSIVEQVQPTNVARIQIQALTPCMG